MAATLTFGIISVIAFFVIAGYKAGKSLFG